MSKTHSTGHRLVEGKVAVVFGAAGAVGRQVCQQFMANGADVYASDRDAVRLEAIRVVEARAVDVLDERAVADYLNEVASNAGRIDVVVNLAGAHPAEYAHGKPAVDVSLEQFMQAQRTSMAPQFVTAKHAYAHLAAAGGGVIVFITSTLARVGSPWCTALTAAHAGTEGLVRSLAKEWGPAGIRVVGVRSEAMPESETIAYTFATMGQNVGLSREQMQAQVESQLAIGRLPSAEDTARVMAFAASDLAAYITGAIVNQSSGHVLD